MFGNQLTCQGQGLPCPCLLVVGNKKGVADLSQKLPDKLSGHLYSAFVLKQTVGILAFCAMDYNVTTLELSEQGLVMSIIGSWACRDHMRLPSYIGQVLHELTNALHTTEPHGGEVVGKDKNSLIRHTCLDDHQFTWSSC